MSNDEPCIPYGSTEHRIEDPPVESPTSLSEKKAAVKEVIENYYKLFVQDLDAMDTLGRTDDRPVSSSGEESFYRQAEAAMDQLVEDLLKSGVTSRGAALLKAHYTINGERQTTYGTPEDSFGLIAYLWEGYLQTRYGLPAISIMPHDVAMLMSLLKIARIAHSADHADSYVDLCGYAALAADIAKVKL